VMMRQKRKPVGGDLVCPFANHVEAIRAVQKWFVEETRLGASCEDIQLKKTFQVK